MNNLHVSSQFGKMADDFFFCILMLKSSCSQNNSLPFLHAHTLELSAKAACLKLDIPLPSKNGHNILDIYSLLQPILPSLEKDIPTSRHLWEYKKIWFNIKTQGHNIELPHPEELYKLELAYFVDNVMNLKYGFNKKMEQVSSVSISNKEINSGFLSLFNTCRNVYADSEINNEIKEKLYNVFGRSPETDRKIAALIKI